MRPSAWLSAGFVAGIVAFPLSPSVRAVSAQDAAAPLHAEFAVDWTQRWMTAELARRVNRFTVAEEGTARVLKVESDRSASALYYTIDRPPRHAGQVSWRWKIDRTLTGGAPERTKRGDDYAARFFVVFDGEPFSRTARAICYVWAAGEPAGSAFRNPFFPNVVTMVLQSGNERSGEWVSEERDFIRDYKAAFGTLPKSVSAIAVMVDTDNTRSRATAWFDKIIVKPPSQSDAATPDN